MTKSSRFVRAVTKSPFLWGALGSVGFYALVEASPLGVPLVRRYFTHHPVEYMETVMFAIGLAALVVKAFDIAAQRAGLEEFFAGTGDEDAATGRRVQRLAGADRAAAGRGVRANTTFPVCARRWSTSAVTARPSRWTTS